MLGVLPLVKKLHILACISYGTGEITPASQNFLRDDEALWFIAGDREAIVRQIYCIRKIITGS